MYLRNIIYLSIKWLTKLLLKDLKYENEKPRCQDEKFLSQCSSKIFPQSTLFDGQPRVPRSTKDRKSKRNKNKNSKNKQQTEVGKDQAFFPDSLNIQLRHHDTLEFTWEFKMPEFQPLDLYFLFDLSFSMKQDLKNLIDYSNILFNMFLDLYPKDAADNFHVGFGSFVDKKIMPASSENEAMLENPCLLDFPGAESKQKCQSNFVFRNDLPLDHHSAEDFAQFLEDHVKVRYVGR